MKEVRVGIIGGGMISHRHMMIYDTIQRRSAELGFTAKVVACCEIIPERLKAWVAVRFGGKGFVHRFPGNAEAGRY